MIDPFFEELYGNRLSKDTYFTLFKGLLTPKVCEMLANDKPKIKPYAYLKSEIESSLFKLNLGLIEKGFNIIKDIEKEEKKVQEDLGPFNILSTSKAKFELEVSSFINSDEFIDKLQGSSEDLINTITFLIKQLVIHSDTQEKNAKGNLQNLEMKYIS